MEGGRNISTKEITAIITVHLHFPMFLMKGLLQSLPDIYYAICVSSVLL